MTETKVITGCNKITILFIKNIEELCNECKQAELCDITKEHKEMKYNQTGTCGLFIMK